MPGYRRALVPGASWFFTVNLLQRRNNDLLMRHVDTLGEAVRRVRRLHPFTINAWVVLPEHMHCVWTLPSGDADYLLRWRLIKIFFCRDLPANEYRSAMRLCGYAAMRLCGCIEASVVSGSGVTGNT